MLATIDNLTLPAEFGNSPHLLLQEIAANEKLCNDAIDLICRDNPLYWLQEHTKTENPKYLEQGREYLAPFPKEGYFVPLFEEFKNWPRLFIPKTREMMTSWAVMGWATHRAQWFKAEVIVQTDSEDKAKELVGYSQQLYRYQDDFLKEAYPLAGEPSQLEQRWSSGGRVFGIPKGEHKIRLYHPTIYIMDEAAFLPEAQQCYDTAHPVAGQIIAISSAGPGWFGDQCTQSIVV